MGQDRQGRARGRTARRGLAWVGRATLVWLGFLVVGAGVVWGAGSAHVALAQPAGGDAPAEEGPAGEAPPVPLDGEHIWEWISENPQEFVESGRRALEFMQAPVRERVEEGAREQPPAGAVDGAPRGPRRGQGAQPPATGPPAGEVEAVGEELSEELSEELDAFFLRAPLRFSFGTVRQIVRDLSALIRRVKGWVVAFGDERPLIVHLRRSIPLQILLLLLLGLWWLDRQARHLRRTIWQFMPPLANRTLDHALDSALRVLVRTLPPALLLLPVYFPLLGIFNGELWLLLVARGLWLLLIYRALRRTAGELLVGEVLDLTDKPFSLKRWFDGGLRVVMGLWAAMEFVELVGYDVAAYRLLAFVMKLFIAVHLLRLLGLADDFLVLLPRDTDSVLVRALRNRFTVYLQLTVGLSTLLMLLWALGYASAAKLIMVRTYAVIGMLVLAFALYRRAHRTLQRLIASQESPEGEPLDREKHQVLRALERSVWTVGVALIIWILLTTIGLWRPLRALASRPIVELGDTIIISVYVVVRGFFILSLFVLGSRALRAVFNEKVYPRFDVDVGVGYAINTMVHYFLFFIGLLLGLKSFGVDLTAIGIFFSALGIGIGFGLQSIVNNLISGLILLFGRSVKKGDYITVNDQYGRVDTVGARSVIVTTPGNYELIIPSAELISTPIINWTLTSPLIRVSIPVGVSYLADVRQVRDVLLESAHRHPKVLRRPRPEVWLVGFGDSSVNFNLLVYIDCRQTNETRVRGELNFHIWDALAEASIEIPFPQRDLHIRSGLDALSKKKRKKKKHGRKKQGDGGASGDQGEPAAPAPPRADEDPSADVDPPDAPSFKPPDAPGDSGLDAPGAGARPFRLPPPQGINLTSRRGDD